jgi:hypothetical protein
VIGREASAVHYAKTARASNLRRAGLVSYYRKRDALKMQATR